MEAMNIPTMYNRNPKIGSILIRMLRFDDKSDGSVMIMINFGVFVDYNRFVCVIRRKKYEALVEDVGYKWIILGASDCAKGVMNIVFTLYHSDF